jgi:hypothetical protein
MSIPYSINILSLNIKIDPPTCYHLAISHAFRPCVHQASLPLNAPHPPSYAVFHATHPYRLKNVLSMVTVAVLLSSSTCRNCLCNKNDKISISVKLQHREQYSNDEPHAGHADLDRGLHAVLLGRNCGLLPLGRAVTRGRRCE